jgi:hypothetical protein
MHPQKQRGRHDPVIDHLQDRALGTASVSVKIPNVTKPMWLTLEKAMRRLTSVWISVT